jgi:Bacterial proteasome activator
MTTTGPLLCTPAEPVPALVHQGKAIRLLSLLGDGVTELRKVEPDDSARRRLVAHFRDVLVEVASAVSDPLIEELVALGFGPLDAGAGVDELVVAETQLFGWLNGLMVAEGQFGSQAPERAPLHGAAS